MLYSFIHFFLQIANSPSFWCGLHLTHRNYARHPRQLVRSCLQLGTLEVIVTSQSKWTSWLPWFQEVCSAVSCTFSPSTCNCFRLNFFPEKSPHSNSPSPRSTRDLNWTFSNWPSLRSIPPNPASQSSCLLAACRPRPGRREKRKWKPNWRVVAKMLLMTSAFLQWLTGRQALRKKRISLVTASAQVIFVNEKIFSLWLPSPHMHHHHVKHVDSNL